VQIFFDTTLVLNGATTATLADANSKTAVCAAVAHVIGLDISQVNVLDSTSVAPETRLRREGRRLQSYNVAVVVRITSSTEDFEDTAVTRDAQALFEKLSTVLLASVNTFDFATTLRAFSVTHAATVTENVGRVTVGDVDTEYTEVQFIFLNCVFACVINSTIMSHQVTTSGSDDKNDDLSEGEYAGVVIGVVAVFLLIVGGVYFLTRNVQSDSGVESTTPHKDSFPHNTDLKDTQLQQHAVVSQTALVTEM
jgi:hypothetical protein